VSSSVSMCDGRRKGSQTAIAASKAAKASAFRVSSCCVLAVHIVIELGQAGVGSGVCKQQ
jgi:hypothetical protein